MKRAMLEREVIRALGESGPLDVACLVTRLDEHPLTVDSVCYRLAATGEIRFLGRGLYELTDAGVARYERDVD